MNTPETDKRVWSDHSEGILYEVVEASFARKLERERDEVRDIAEKLSKQGLEMMDENRSLKRERDEARAERDILRLNSLGTIQLNIPVTTDWKEETK